MAASRGRLQWSFGLKEMSKCHVDLHRWKAGHVHEQCASAKQRPCPAMVQDRGYASISTGEQQAGQATPSRTKAMHQAEMATQGLT